MSRKLFTAKDVERCFPWITAGTTNYRVKQDIIKLEHPSTGTGIPNVFTLRELVHCAVIDELATLGVFGNLHSTSINYTEEVTPQDGQRQFKTFGSPDPYFVDLDFYQRHDFNVVAEIQIHHEDQPGVNVHDVVWHDPTPEIPIPHMEPIPKGWGRYYYVLFSPERDLEGNSFIRKQLAYWLKPEKEKINSTLISKAFIRVRRLYNMAAKSLGLPK